MFLLLKPLNGSQFLSRKKYIDSRDSKDNELWGFNRYFLKIADLPPNILSEIKSKSRSKSKSVESHKVKKWFISLKLLSKSHILSKARYLYHSKRFLLYFWKKSLKYKKNIFLILPQKITYETFFCLWFSVWLTFSALINFKIQSKKIKTNSNA